MDVDLVDQAGLDELFRDPGTTADSHVLSVGRALRQSHGGGRPPRHEVKGSSPLADQGLPLVVREHEDREVERWILAPPSVPYGRIPGSRAAAKHVAPHEERTGIRVLLEEDLGVRIGDSTLQPSGPSPYRQLPHPVVQKFPVNSQGMLRALLRTGDEAV